VDSSLHPIYYPHFVPSMTIIFLDHPPLDRIQLVMIQQYVDEYVDAPHVSQSVHYVHPVVIIVLIP
jgi:hypothetical protein